MRTQLLAAAIILIAALAAAQTPDTFQQGLAAYQAGNSARALEIWRPLAEGGHVRRSTASG